MNEVNGFRRQAVFVIDIETTGLNPFEDRITAIGIQNTIDENPTVFIDKNEKTILKKFVSLYNSFKVEKVIGFNIGFDMRFLLLRCLKHGLFFDWQTELFDLKEKLDFNQRKSDFEPSRNLNNYANLILNEKKNSDGLQAIVFWNEKEFDKLYDYCFNDVVLTKKLYDKLSGVDE